jgi:hypothetical protein
MQSEEILDALEEYLGQYVGGTRKLAWEDPYRGDLFKFFLQAYKQGYAQSVSPAPLTGSAIRDELIARAEPTPPARTSANSWTRSSSSGTPGAMRSIGTRKGCDGGHPDPKSWADAGMRHARSVMGTDSHVNERAAMPRRMTGCRVLSGRGEETSEGKEKASGVLSRAFMCRVWRHGKKGAHGIKNPLPVILLRRGHQHTRRLETTPRGALTREAAYPWQSSSCKGCCSKNSPALHRGSSHLRF